MNHYVRISLETHLFFARIMKEHAFFLQAGFVQKDVEWIKKADYFRRQFEELLKDTVVMSNRMVSEKFLSSGEMVAYAPTAGIPELREQWKQNTMK